MNQEIRKYVPNNWTTSPTTIISRNSDEFSEIERAFAKSRLRILKLDRIQNINAYGLYLIRQQFLSADQPENSFFKVRKYVTVPRDQVDIALKHQLDSRRCNPSTFSSTINASGDDAVFIVSVVTDSPYNDTFIQDRSNDFYIEYVVYLE